jgi:sugar phosphate isomerase/epimerase
MRLSTSTNIIFERADGSFVPVKESIRLCSEAGYQVLDLCFQDLFTSKSFFCEKNWQDGMKDILLFSQSKEITFSQGHAVVHDFCNHMTDHDSLYQLMLRCVDGASILEIPWLVVHPSTDRTTAAPYQTSRKKNVEYFLRLTEYASSRKVGIAVENMWDAHMSPLCAYARDAEELADLVDRVPALGVCWDVEHGSIMKQNQGEMIRFLGKRIVATHISDQTGLDNFHILPFHGITDWNEIIQALSSIDYQGDFTYEAQHYLTHLPMELVPEALRYSVTIGDYLVGLFHSGENVRK